MQTSKSLSFYCPKSPDNFIENLQDSQVLMIFKHDDSPQRQSFLPSIPRYSEQRNRQVPNTHTLIPKYHHSSNLHFNSDRDFTSKSLKLKSQRNYYQRILSQRERKTIHSLKASFHENFNDRKSQSYDQFTNQKEMETLHKQTKINQFYTKNSLMNKLLSHHKKINQINFQDSRSQLFGNFHKSSIYINQNISDLKPSSDSPNDKIIALLNDRPFKKASPLKYNISKLKMMQNIKKLAKKNVLLNPSFNQVQCQEDEEQKSQRQMTFTSNLKSNRSLKFIEKPFIRTDLLKGCVKSFNKLERLSSLQRQQKQKKKKSLLMISDDQRQQKNLETINSQFSQGSMKQAQNSGVKNETQSKKDHSNQKQLFDKDEKNDQQNRQIKCQQRILSDLVRLQQMRNKQCYAENKVLRLKSSRLFAQSIKQIKLQAKEKDKLASHKVKYLVKFKTEPKQNPHQKLQAKLSRMVPEIQTLRKRLLEETKFEGEQISGIAQPLKQRVTQMREKEVREVRSFRGTNRKFEHSLMDKEVTGWEFQNQADGRDHWNFRF